MDKSWFELWSLSIIDLGKTEVEFVVGTGGGDGELILRSHESQQRKLFRNSQVGEEAVKDRLNTHFSSINKHVVVVRLDNMREISSRSEQVSQQLRGCPRWYFWHTGPATSISLSNTISTQIPPANVH